VIKAEFFVATLKLKYATITFSPKLNFKGQHKIKYNVAIWYGKDKVVTQVQALNLAEPCKQLNR
jgi:hypothetical protein